MSRRALVGSGSHMPEAMLLKKMEQTCMFEDPDELNKYYRNVLKDYGPDATYMASETPPRNNFSKQKLNLRACGRMTQKEPDLPDGTFLDYEFLAPDPRRTMLEPDFTKFKEHTKIRSKTINFSNDDSNTIHEGVWQPDQITKEIRNQYKNLKARWRIFSDSLMGRIAGNGGKHVDRTKCMSDMSGKTPDFQEAVCSTRNAIHVISNRIPVGWRRTTDHMFSIADYSQVRSLGSVKDQNWYKNRGSSKMDHDVHVSWKDNNTSKALALKMIDIANQKNTTFKLADQIVAEESKQGANRSAKITIDDMLQTQSLDVQDRTPEVLKNNYREGINQKMPEDRKYTILNPDFVESITSVNKNMRQQELADLRESVERSAEQNGIFIESKNSALIDKRDNSIQWQTEFNCVKGKSMTLANYRTLNNKINPVDKELFDFEKFRQNSKTSGNKQRILHNTMYPFLETEHNTTAGKETSMCVNNAPVSIKSMRKYTANDIESAYEITAS
jgi:predicted house-cleaning noncanonical NTP pyrophosphatase (MazG superfamily)